MRIQNIKVRFFRTLADASINLEDDITLIVGKNNTGKTSLLEIIKILTSNDDSLSFEDFSQSSYSLFKEMYSEYEKSLVEEISEEDKEAIEIDIQNRFPKIQLQIEFIYDKAQDSLVELSEFITDLDEERCDACALLSYEPINTLGLLKMFHNRDDEEITLIPYFKENLNSFYKVKCYAKDIKSDYQREIELGFKEKLKKIVSFEDIKALRILDDKKNDKNKTLALGFSKYYNERDKTDQNVQAVEDQLKKVSVDLKEKYDAVLVKILKDLRRFGASTPVVIPKIVIDSEFDSESVMRNNIKYYYQQEEINLPESYNGLGYSNLIYMILELASFIQRFRNAKDDKISEFLCVLIEEPEAHMHPQMQQVFISQIKGILDEAKKDNIDVQLIITSHSSHILSEAGIDSDKGFKRIRYFNRIEGGIEVKDFNSLKISNEKQTARFLKQYLTLHKSDLFFSDKVIIVEGTTERMLMPQLIFKSAPSLATQYVSILEVGGAYTHKFKEILEFLKLKTLVVTDIDSVNADDGERCEVNKGENGELTSNYTLKGWIPNKTTITDLLDCDENDKLENSIIRVAFQTEENGIVGRSFEEAFINTNLDLIKSTYKDEKDQDKATKNLFSFSRGKSVETLNTKTPYGLAPTSSSAKTNFAFDVMSFPEDDIAQWQVPVYIDEGLKWLEKPLAKEPKAAEVEVNTANQEEE
ncbi:AAA family ATPase [Croceibacter atlanticus]|uniref:ATP-dependent nuclease n=1 Tax=Croceibacter atlanticus TaxID=313588 RepID=UPI001C5FDD9F|nr:AAA family ATPase [Croceibacter atlanticus]MBW4971284.1 AAA family ATPase [Croceibacter atlanticus]